MKPTRIFVGIAAAIVLAAIVTLFTDVGRELLGSSNSNDARQVELGAQIYRDNCAACHGASLEGQPDWQTRRADGRLPAPPHDETGHTWHHADEVLFRIVKDGVAAIVPGYDSDMPAYADVLTDEEIRAVLAFIKSQWPPRIRARHDDMNLRIRESR